MFSDILMIKNVRKTIWEWKQILHGVLVHTPKPSKHDQKSICKLYIRYTAWFVSLTVSVFLTYRLSFTETGGPGSIHQDGLKELPQLPADTHGDLLFLLRRQLR